MRAEESSRLKTRRRFFSLQRRIVKHKYILSTKPLVTSVSQEKLFSDIRLVASLLFQILHNPVRQRFGRGRVLAGVQLTVNHNIGLESCHLLILSPEFFDPVLQQESEILGVITLVNICSRRKVLMINNLPQPSRWPFPLPRW